MKIIGLLLVVAGIAGLAAFGIPDEAKGPLAGPSAAALLAAAGAILGAGGLGALTYAGTAREGAQEALLLVGALGTLGIASALFFGVWHGWPVAGVAGLFLGGIAGAVLAFGLGLWIFLKGPARPIVFYPAFVFSLVDLAFFALVLAKAAVHA